MIVTIYFFNDPATTAIYPLSLHDALPIWRPGELRNEFVGIHEHRAERRVARALEMQQQQARLRRDRDLHLLREDESPASLEMLVPQEYLHQSKQALALVRAQPASERDVLLHDPVPRVRDRAGRQPERTRRHAAQHGGHSDVSRDNEDQDHADDCEPFHLIPPAVESLRLHELPGQRLDRKSTR